MAGAAELPRPGVEVVQQFATTSPTIVTPTLVPCIVAPFFEVIEALNSDGTTNDNARLQDPYTQTELVVDQSSFPSPRGNINQVNVLEDSVRAFFEFGGSLIELSKTQAFLTSYLDPDVSTQPYVVGSTTEPVGGFDVDGRTLILCLDAHTSLSSSEFVSGANLPTSKNVTVTFSAAVAGGNLTLDEVIAQVNAVLPGVASNDGTDKLKLSSTKYGAKSSVVVRKTGTAIAGTDRLGFSASYDTVAVGSGFYADDDSDGDTTSPRLKIYMGSQQILQNAYPGTAQTTTTAPFVTSYVEAGDTVIADGVNIGEVLEVQSDQLTMAVEQSIVSQDRAFAPRRVWVRANNLTYPVPSSSEAATLTGTIQTADESPAYVCGQAAATGGFPIGPAESIVVNVVENGVALPTYTVSSGSGWATLSAVVSAINGLSDAPFEAYFSNPYGEEITLAYHTAHASTSRLGLRTKADNTGSGAAITVVSSTVATALGFTSLPVGDVGENVRYMKGTPAIFTSTNPVASFAGTESITYTVTRLGSSLGASTFTLPSATGIDACVAAWNDSVRYTEAYKSTSAGIPSATGTYLSIRTRGENVGSTASILISADSASIFTAAPPVTHAGTDTNLNGTVFKWSLDTSAAQHQVTFVADEDDGGTSFLQVVDKINELTPGIAAADASYPPFLSLTSKKYGESSQVKVLDGTANTKLGFTTNQEDFGDGRPAPDFALDVNGDAVIQSQLLRDGLTGLPYAPGSASLLISYKGLRLDLSPEADNPSLLVIDSVDTLREVADPISTDNPGSLMCYLALLNSPSVSVAAIGVPEVSDDAPDGTPAGYASCADFLQNQEVYALAIASQNPAIHQAMMAHVNAMSEPEQKGERILFFNPPIQTRANSTVLGSGTDANSTVVNNQVVVDVNLAPALIQNGIDPNIDINPTSGPIVNEVYLDLGGSDKNYLVQKVENGTKVYLRTSFVSGDGNSDNFYHTVALSTPVVSDNWSVSIRGDQLVVPGTTKPDYGRIAETIQAAAQAYGFRRGFYVHPDQVGINVSGLEQVVKGYYATACVAGMVGQLPPQQGFTNYPIVGLTRLVGSNDVFTNQQLNVMAAGGVYILAQDVQGSPVTCRHQLSTSMTSIETRELSITKVVDYASKFQRLGLRNFIGRSNITQPFLDTLSTVVTGMLKFMSDNSIIIGGDINNILQSAEQPDTVLIDETLDVPYPCNYIRLTIVI
jgi:hypothetical protein